MKENKTKEFGILEHCQQLQDQEERIEKLEKSIRYHLNRINGHETDIENLQCLVDFPDKLSEEQLAYLKNIRKKKEQQPTDDIDHRGKIVRCKYNKGFETSLTIGQQYYAIPDEVGDRHYMYRVIDNTYPEGGSVNGYLLSKHLFEYVGEEILEGE